MYHHPYILNNQGQPITVLYPGYYSNIAHRPIIKEPRLAYTSSLQQPFNRNLPELDPSLFNESAISMQSLMKEASLILQRLADSKEFGKKIMTAAQESNLVEVERLIKSTGIKSKVDTSYNPDGINLKLSSKVGDTDCCHLTIALRWQ